MIDLLSILLRPSSPNYQLNTSLIRILAESNEPVSIPSGHNLPGDELRTITMATNEPAPVSDPITKAINDFPHKKQKVQKGKGKQN